MDDLAGTAVASEVPLQRVPAGKSPVVSTRESLVVLTRDGALVETLKVLGSERDLLNVAAESALADAMARLTLLFNERLTQGRLIDPPSDSAKFYLAQLVQSQATHPSTVLARQALAGRTLDEAKGAIRRQDFVGARRWLTEARDAGGDDAAISAVEHDMTVAQDNVKRAAEVVSAGNLEITRYVPPTLPVSARQRGVSGWVDVQFVVKPDGLVSDVIITGAQPVGVFEQAAVDAVRKWRYRPVQRDGHAVDQRARLRMKFALDK